MSSTETSTNGKDSLVAQALRDQQFLSGPSAPPPSLDATMPARVMIRTESDLFRVAREHFDRHKIDADTAARCASHRKHVAPWASSIDNRLGLVDEKTWSYQLECAIKAVIEQQHASQPNGNWQLRRAEIERVDRMHTHEVPVGPPDPMTGVRPTQTVGERRTYFVCAFELVDVLGEPNMIYVMGKPVGYEKRPGEESAITEAMMALLTQLQGRSAEVHGAPLTSAEMTRLTEENAALKATVARIEERLNAMLEPSGE